MANFEKIKSMNSYQLALFISTIESNEETNVRSICRTEAFNTATDIEKWLREEFENV
jgi:hypothetical protein